MMRCVIVDDEPLAVECLTGYVGRSSDVELVGAVSNPLELTQLLQNTSADLIFLDIQMPVINGIDYLKMTPNPPMTIITSAFPTFALEGYQLDVLDYLLKPITFDRFSKALQKAKDYFALLQRSKTDSSKQTVDDYFFVKSNSRYERIQVSEVLFIQAVENYVNIVTTQGKYMTLLSLKDVNEKLNQQEFVKVHKSFIVSIAKIDAIENNDIVIQSSKIPIGRNHREEVLEKVVGSKLWRKPSN
jgi:DNA-binding LytR/AlgR family response regulator